VTTTAPEGFEELFHTEYSRLVRCLRAIDDDAADAVQEAFAQAFVRWRRVGTLEDPAGWVRRVAVNRLLNARRSRSRRDAAIARMDATEVMTDRVEDVDLWRSVRSLPRQQQVAVALFYGGDLPIDDVAEAMNLSDGAVKYHLHAGRERLREMLGDPVDD
jgi:RNA polymerase sigma-70 factor (ECF subfamily)